LAPTAARWRPSAHLARGNRSRRPARQVRCRRAHARHASTVSRAADRSASALSSYYTVVYLRPMSLGRRWCSVLLVSVGAALMTGCGDDPPAKEIQQAQQAIDTARASGADRYARE